MMIEKVGEPSAVELWIARAEKPSVWIALLSIGLYLGELRGLWTAWGLEPAYRVVSLAIDLLFAADLLVKVWALGKPYLRSPWFFIDLISTLPLVSAFGHIPEEALAASVPQALRVVRLMRLLRMVRVIRTLRVLRVLRDAPFDGAEGKPFQRALYGSVLAFSAVLLWLMSAAQRSAASPEALREAEFLIALAALAGMGAMLVVARYLIPDISTRQVRGLLNVALPHQVAEHFLHHPERYDEAVHAAATILFTDIKGFTHTVEGLGGQIELAKRHLERVLDTIVEVHQRHDLIVDKFIGDAVMSFRGGPLVAGDAAAHATRVVLASLESQRAVVELGDPYFKAVKIGGASSGDCMIGAFGTSKRLSYTALGDGVNLAARLEPASGAIGARNLFCDLTRNLVGEHPGVFWRLAGELRVAGKDRSTKVHEAIDTALELSQSWISSFERGLGEYREKRFREALELFRETERARTGGDPLSTFYAALCERYARDGVGADWRPVIELRKG